MEHMGLTSLKCSFHHIFKTGAFDKYVKGWDGNISDTKHHFSFVPFVSPSAHEKSHGRKVILERYWGQGKEKYADKFKPQH